MVSSAFRSSSEDIKDLFTHKCSAMLLLLSIKIHPLMITDPSCYYCLVMDRPAFKGYPTGDAHTLLVIRECMFLSIFRCWNLTSKEQHRGLGWLSHEWSALRDGRVHSFFHLCSLTARAHQTPRHTGTLVLGSPASGNDNDTLLLLHF